MPVQSELNEVNKIVMLWQPLFIQLLGVRHQVDSHELPT